MTAWGVLIVIPLDDDGDGIDPMFGWSPDPLVLRRPRVVDVAIGPRSWWVAVPSSRTSCTRVQCQEPGCPGHGAATLGPRTGAARDRSERRAQIRKQQWGY